MSLLTRRNLILPPWAPLGLDTAVDTFADADGTGLIDHKPDGGGAWLRQFAAPPSIPVIDANRLHNLNDTLTRVWIHSAVPIDPDYDVSADVVMRSDNDVGTAGVAARVALLDGSQYFARYNSNGNAWELFKGVGNVGTQLGTFGQVLVVDQPYRLTLRCIGPAISLIVDSVAVIAVTDADVTAKGRAAIRLNQAATSTTGVHIDNWQAVANNL